ncbi:MAG: oxygen-independent coproporphyrinogen III oxidase [Planctomycetota bacterium]
MTQQVSVDLLERYDQPGPRYTSYPTAPVWGEGFGPSDYAERLSLAGECVDRPMSVYVHIPYCERLCLYCACNVVITRDAANGEDYAQAVLNEARLVARHMGSARPVVQHHWGGGTPTFLAPDVMRRLFDGLAELFPPAPGAEVSIEVDPRVTTREHLRALAAAGFRRISLGVQDFDATVQLAIHREQSFDLTRGLIADARALGFDSVNLDLVYGLPQQSVPGFDRTLEQVHELAPDRIACYSYAHVPWLKKHQRAIDESALPRGADKLALYQHALEFLADRGYEPIGMDHFSRREDELAVAARQGRLHRNFMGYTTRAADDLIGLGLTAISEVHGAFAQNHKAMSQWRAALADDSLPTTRGHLRSEEDERRRGIVLDLMCRFICRYDDHGGVDSFRSRYGEELQRLSAAVDDGLVRVDDEAITVTRVGRLFVRNVCMAFDEYLGREQPKRPQVTERFSRTI